MSFLWKNKTGDHFSTWKAAPPSKRNPDPFTREETSGSSRCRGSLTVEAAVLMPLFLLTVYLFWTMFTAYMLHTRLQFAMDQLTGELAQQSYLLDVLSASEGASLSEKEAMVAKGLEGVAWKTYAKAKLTAAVGKGALKAAPLKGGAGGLSVAGSRWDRKGDIRLVVRYQLTFPGVAGRILRLPVEQESRRKCWTGKDPPGAGTGQEDSGGEKVYVTETGRVYHRDINCYHLNVTVRTVSLGGAKAARNRSGGRYKPCEHCAVSSAVPGTVYITPEGNRYHVTRDCSGLKRTVRLVPLDGVGLPPCSHCG